MTKAVIYDADGMVLHGTRFSDSYAEEFGIPIESMAPFFAGPFQKCILGQADLKEELTNGDWLQKWHWQGTVEELLDYWFYCGDEVDGRILDSVASIRAKGIVCTLATNQEKYRAAYLRDALGLAEHFDTVVVSSEVGHKKPDPEFFEKVMEHLHTKDPTIQRSEILFWDNREANIASAKEFGFQSHLFKDFGEYQKAMSSLAN